MTDKDRDWLEPVRAELQQSVDTIDAATRARLAHIRQQALTRAPSSRLPRYAFPVVAVLATACLVIAITLNLRQPQPAQYEMIDDLDLITTSESLELIEDLEFYEWLEDYDLPG
ncbi:MAG: hypothetical protein HW386_807 [Gammaproteobacteria bacterium]|nr:hypothetical protein [Gammaproteobacteria bacterium]